MHLENHTLTKEVKYKWKFSPSTMFAVMRKDNQQT
jgi:hypothetical protein